MAAKVAMISMMFILFYTIQVVVSIICFKILGIISWEIFDENIHMQKNAEVKD